MNISTCCCLKPLPPTPSSSVHPTSSPSLRTNTNHVPRKANEKSSYSRRNTTQLLAIATTIVIGLEVGEYVSNINGNYYSMASELTMESQVQDNNNNKRGIARWSDKRSCPPWHINSLESIVPENLPRPYAHRKWEGVSYSSKSAPSVKFLLKTRTSCYSM